METRSRYFYVVFALACMLQLGVAHSADRYGVEIKNTFSGLRADVMWASTVPYQGVFLWPNNNSASQVFDLLDSGNGYFRIRARHSGQCLMPDWRNWTGRGTRIMQYPYCAPGYAASEWRRAWVDVPAKCNGDVCSTTNQSYPILVNRYSGLCLDSANGSGGVPPQQAVLQLWDCVVLGDDWNIENQAWTYAGDGLL